jgi:hypothetical protein
MRRKKGKLMAEVQGFASPDVRMNFPGGNIVVTWIEGQVCTMDQIADALTNGDYGSAPYAVTILGNCIYMQLTDDLVANYATIVSDINNLCTPI